MKSLEISIKGNEICFEEMVYQVVQGEINRVNKINNKVNLEDTIEAHITKRIGELSLKRIASINFTNPTEEDMLLYLMYKTMKQKHNDLEVLECIKDKLHWDLDKDIIIDKKSISEMIDTFQTQVRLLK